MANSTKIYSNHPHIAILELGHSHAECLYSQIQFLLKAKYNVHLICSEELRKIIQQFGLSFPVQYYNLKRNTLSYYKSLWSIRKYLTSNNLNKIVVNSVTNKVLRDFSYIAPVHADYTGVLHNTDNFMQFENQKTIDKIFNRYFVLNDYLIESIKVAVNKPIGSFYPIFFPRYLVTGLQKPKNEFWICIPGQVEFKRRDYIKLFESLTESFDNTAIKFFLLGQSNHPGGNGREIRELIRDSNIEHKIVMFDRFIEDNEFHTYIRQADLILPLIHPDEPEFSSYKNSQISGAFNLAFAHRVPMLLDSYYQNIEEFAISSFFYSEENLGQAMLDLEKSPELIQTKKLEIENYAKFNFQFQQSQYLNFLWDK